ncbi:hypothetical protein E3O19_05930 [Cryobacterium algoritolerans]|uniref:Transposase IS110-like N-terminal domain-containing protein n=1 Tax=Cryobacterium algoritolerans TaxID=1259184 RepID=A0A4R8WV14_9MICO|nr:transposase [Cryobacterium algoritolerans]TFC17587.1 hypothetical protein E3O19_05930 [Cryobacterium algoritolerans]
MALVSSLTCLPASLNADPYDEYFHHAAVSTEGGKEIADRQFPATSTGYQELCGWAIGHGFITKAGVECTGSYGLGLTDVLVRRGIWVIDVIAPGKQLRRVRGKTDQIDSVNAARAVMNEIATTIPKTRNGTVEALRVLRSTRKLLVKQCTESINQLQGLLVSAPAELRESLAKFTGKTLAQACSKLRDRASDDIVMRTTRQMLRSLAKRCLEMFAETAPR